MSEVRLAACLKGPADAPIVILANPIGTTRAIWDAQARVLRSRYRLLRFELRGHGEPDARSDAPPGPYSIAELGADVLRLMREYSVSTAAYCGVSIGEMIPPRWFTEDFIARQPAAVSFVMDMLNGTDPGGYAGCGEAIAGMDLRPALGSVKAPTLVIAGAEDSAAPAWQGATTAIGISDSRLAVIRGTSHLAPYQTPGPVTDAILAHLASI
jgi:pimeloyl-ACP methyl ester carboxylesterase